MNQMFKIIQKTILNFQPMDQFQTICTHRCRGGSTSFGALSEQKIWGLLANQNHTKPGSMVMYYAFKVQTRLLENPQKS